MKPATALLVLALCPMAGGAVAAPTGAAPTCAASEPAVQRTAEQRRRHRQVWSDSLWLVKQVRAGYPERLAGIHVDTTQADPVRPRLVIRVTGREPLPPMRLGDRARDVPVVVEYGARHSLKAVEALRARVGPQVRALLPELQGEGYDEAAGTMHLDVYAPDAAAKAAALSRCAALEAVYGMPVRIAAHSSRASVQ